MNNDFPKIKNRDKMLYRVFVILSVLCVLNLNVIANKIFGMERFFSPFILGFAIFGILLSRKSLFSDLGKYGSLFVVSLVVHILIGLLAAVAEKNMQAVPGELLGLGASMGIAIAVLLMVRRLAEAGHADRLMRFAFWLSVASSSTIFVSYVFPNINESLSSVHTSGRYSGFFGNPNEFAIQALIAIGFGFCLASRTLDVRYLFVTFAVCAPAILLSHSRTGLLGMTALVSVLSLIVFPRKYVVRTFLSLLLVGVIGFFGVGYLKSLKSGGESVALEKRTNQLFQLLQGKIQSNTTGGRSDLAIIATRLIKQRPFTGHGLGFMNVMPGTEVGPHNTFLKLIGESGVAGTLLFFTFWPVFSSAILGCKIRWLQVGMLGVFLAVTINMMSGHSSLSRRFIVLQLSVMIALADPKTQKHLSRQSKKLIPRRLAYMIKPTAQHL